MKKNGLIWKNICSIHYSQMDELWWRNLLKKPLDEKQMAEKEEETSDLENMGLKGISLRHENELLLFLQGVVSGVFGDIYRAKGFLKTGNAWLRFDVVDKTYTITHGRIKKCVHWHKFKTEFVARSTSEISLYKTGNGGSLLQKKGRRERENASDVSKPVRQRKKKIGLL